MYRIGRFGLGKKKHCYMAYELYGVFTIWCRMFWLGYIAFELYGVLKTVTKSLF